MLFLVSLGGTSEKPGRDVCYISYIIIWRGMSQKVDQFFWEEGAGVSLCNTDTLKL